MFNSKELFSVVEYSPTVFAKTERTSLHYALTLFLHHKKEKSLLLLTSPGFRVSIADETRSIETVIQIVFSDFLLDFFHTQAFSFIGKFLQKLTGCLLYSSAVWTQVKDSIVRLKTDSSFESTLQFLQIMKTLAMANDALLLNEKLSVPPGSSQAAIKMQKVKAYVMENYRNPISINEAAGIAGMSPRSFTRFFKQYASLTFVDYVNAIRVEQASRLLLKTDDTVWGVACSCGFSSPGYFSDVFRRYKGMTPGEFRIKN